MNSERSLRAQAEALAAAKAEEVERLKGELTVLQVIPHHSSKICFIAVEISR